MSMKTRGRITATVSAILLAVFLFAGQVFASDLIYVDLEVTYDQETAREMLDLVNEFRLSDEAYYLNPDNSSTTSYVGQLGELTYDYNLEGVAMQRAYEIALNFRHQRPDDGSIYSIDYNGKHTSGENIACGSGTKMDTYEEAFLAFKEDDKLYDEQGHRRNMLNSSWEAVGMAHVVIGNVHYWVQEFSSTESDNNYEVEPCMETRLIEDIPWNVEDLTLVTYLEKGATGSYYTGYYGQTADLPAVNVWYTANPDSAMKSNVKVNGVLYSFITGYLHGGPVPEDRYSISWESEDESIVTTDGSTYTIVGIGLVKLTCTVTSGDETVSAEMYVNAKKMPLSNENITITMEDGPFIYTGAQIKPAVTVMNGDIPLQLGTDYKLKYTNNINTGTATVQVYAPSGNLHYSGSVELDFTITGTTIEDGELEITPDEFTYSGDANVPDITVTMQDGTVLDPSTDYDVSYSDNVNAGTCTVTVTGKGAYDGTLTGEFTIVPKHLEKEEIYVSGIPDQVYTGSAITPELTIFYGDIELEKDVDYTVSFEDNTEPGDAAVIVTLTGNYDGETTDTFAIVKKLAEDLTVSDIPDQFYTGKVITPEVNVYDGSTKLTEGVDYSVTYRNSTDIGTATVVIDLIGSHYSGSIETTFNIVADVGWKHNDKGWWYINEDGNYPVSTWQKIGGKWYYFKSNGYMATGWQKISGKWYYLNSSGSMATGWKKVDGKWYYLNSNGTMATGWKQVDGSWYYLNSDGSMATGWKKLGGKWYYLKQNGAMVVGAYVIDGKQYKFDSSGAMI